MADINSESLAYLLNPKTAVLKTGETLTKDTDPRNSNACIPIVIKYTGAEAGCWVKVDASSIIFNIGASEASATVDTNIGTAGVIDISAAAYDTFGELVDYINTCTGYKAYLLDAYRAQDVNGKLLAVASGATANFKTANGQGLAADISATEILSIGITKNRFNGSNVEFDGDQSGVRNEVWHILGKGTYTSGSLILQVREVDDKNATEKIIWEKVMATTAVDKSLTFTQVQMSSAEGKRLVVSIGGKDYLGYASAIFSMSHTSMLRAIVRSIVV